MSMPKDFIWGMASAAYQTEGAWDVDGKGPSIWDQFCHKDPSRITDKSNGDIAMDSYNKYKEDVQLLKNMNAKMYRFSISWPRILPKGSLEVVNQAGIDYYNKLIDELLSNGIEPCVTLFHWDLPQSLQEMGGFENEQMTEFFSEYSRLCFKSFGARVKFWITFNEPYIYAMKGYDYANFAPGIKEPLEAPYKVVHTMLKCHALAYGIYQREFKDQQKGKIGLSIDSSNYSARNSDAKEDIEAADKCYQFRIGWIANPLFHGEYPSIMKESIAEKSKLQGRSKSRLPTFDSVSSSMIKNSVDFIGLNYYTSELVQPIEKVEEANSSTNGPGWNNDLGTDRIRDTSGRLCGALWQRDVPRGIRNTLNWIRKEYGNPPVIITENGMSARDDSLDDLDRVEFFRGHITETLKAIKEDGCNVKGYLGWCLLDVFEWAEGYTIGFGVHRVDRSSKEKTRTPKKSAEYLTKVFKENGIPKED